MDSPDLSSLNEHAWRRFIRTRGEVMRPSGTCYFDTYYEEAMTYGEDLRYFKKGIEAQDPRAIQFLTEFVVWRMNNNQGDTP